MILHIFTQVSDYSIEFIKLLSENFQTDQHTLVFRSKRKRDLLESKTGIRMLFLESRSELIKNMPLLMIESEKIIFHSFPVSRSLFFWYTYRRHFNKTIWSVWGQDAYWFKYCKKTPENLIYEWIRRQLIKRLPLILCPIKGDYEYIKKHYDTQASYQPGMYPVPTDFDLLRTLRINRKTGNSINIQVGNSANPTNNTLEVLQFLKSHLNENFKVYCPLSYGDANYAEKVIAFGICELRDNFVPITKFLDKNEYANFISSMDVLIMNHDRQEGLGNIFSYLFLGKKVYIRKDNSSFAFFIEKGIKVFDTKNLLEKDDFRQLYELYGQEVLHNMELTEQIVSSKRIIMFWEAILT